MTRTRKALAVAAAAGLAALAASVLLAPPRTIRLRQPDWRPAGAVLHGAFHVHTTRSDGTGTMEEVAAAAARAGLQFVVFTDHGDATRPPESPRYLSGVLCLDGVEISTTGGHYAAVGLPASPYPLAGEPRDVVEDVARLGGFGVVTHPDSRKPGLSWSAWDTGFDAVEWLNADSEWRDEPAIRLARAVATYPFRPAETLAWLLDGQEALQRWDRVAASRRVVVAGRRRRSRQAWFPGAIGSVRGASVAAAAVLRVQLPYLLAARVDAGRSLGPGDGRWMGARGGHPGRAPAHGRGREGGAGRLRIHRPRG